MLYYFNIKFCIIGFKSESYNSWFLNDFDHAVKALLLNIYLFVSILSYCPIGNYLITYIEFFCPINLCLVVHEVAVYLMIFYIVHFSTGLRALSSGPLSEHTWQQCIGRVLLSGVVLLLLIVWCVLPILRSTFLKHFCHFLCFYVLDLEVWSTDRWGWLIFLLERNTWLLTAVTSLAILATLM